MPPSGLPVPCLAGTDRDHPRDEVLLVPQKRSRNLRSIIVSLLSSVCVRTRILPDYPTCLHNSRRVCSRANSNAQSVIERLKPALSMNCLNSSASSFDHVCDDAGQHAVVLDARVGGVRVPPGVAEGRRRRRRPGRGWSGDIAVPLTPHELHSQLG